MNEFNTMYYLITGVVFIISLIVEQTLKSKFAKYSRTPMYNGLTGREIAEKMLHDHGIYDVKVISSPGYLTDHYNPVTKTVNLSEAVYSQANAASAAVAAHEVGHAIQHAKAYAMLELRSKLVPVVQVSSHLLQWVLLAGIIIMAIGGGKLVFGLGVALFALTTLFAFITLPVEYDASRRALAWLKSHNMLLHQEYENAEDALKWAARTYVVAALGSLAQLIYFATILLRRD